MSFREPIVKPVAIADLRPTQMTVGVREVKEKRKRWHDESKKKGAEFLGKHMIPVVLGPKHRHYIIDHHHLALALHDEGVEEVMVTVVKNLTTLEPDSFWFVLDNHSWMHSYDDEGRLRPYKDLPKTVTGLIDEPFRSLAGELRRAGGFAKDTTPFSEFLWADFLRRRVKRKTVETHFETPSSKPWNWPKTRRRATFPAGVPSWRIEGMPILREKSATAPRNRRAVLAWCERLTDSGID